MATKAQREQRNRQLRKQLRFVREQKLLLENKLNRMAMACEITRRDLVRKINWQPHCVETGSEQVERFERGMTIAIDRLEEVRDSHDRHQPINWRQPLWREGTGE